MVLITDSSPTKRLECLVDAFWRSGYCDPLTRHAAIDGLVDNVAEGRC
jgi:hypothetical protein